MFQVNIRSSYRDLVEKKIQSLLQEMEQRRFRFHSHHDRLASYYTLLSVKDSQGNSQEDKFPIIVNNFSPLTVLVVLSYPTFESTFLKNFIVSRGNKLVLRSQLSRNNFGYEYINHEPLKILRHHKKYTG